MTLFQITKTTMMIKIQFTMNREIMNKLKSSTQKVILHMMILMKWMEPMT